MTGDGNYFGGKARYQAFTGVKYLVYALLSLNIYLFLQQELLALEHTFIDSIDPGQLIQVFSATIDTAAWVLLLLLFELETSVLDDKSIRGLLKWCLHGIRGVCYVAVFYAFTGYCAELITLYKVVALEGAGMCSYVDGGYSLLVGMDEYQPLGVSNCAAAGSEIYRLVGFDILADGETLRSAQRLAWVDVVNSAAWLLVVIILEVEVRLQLRGDLSERIMGSTKIFKLLIYGALFVAAGYWGFAGEFLDFWDAALWLFAFIFIELNVFEWQYETSRQSPANA